MTLTLYAAVDVAGGRASQVAPGHPDDPLTVASGFVEAGASWLHVVDLDQAFGRGHNRDVLRDLIAAVPVPAQLSGGIDNPSALRAAVDTGAQRINLASTALLGDDSQVNCAFVKQAIADHGERIVVGLDVRAGSVVARGTNVVVGSVEAIVARLADTGAQAFVVADATRDGTREGVDAAMFRVVSDALRRFIPNAFVVASGGVATLADLRELADLEERGVCGVVLGAALHHGAFTIEQAQAAVRA